MAARKNPSQLETVQGNKRKEVPCIVSTYLTHNRFLFWSSNATIPQGTLVGGRCQETVDVFGRVQPQRSSPLPTIHPLHPNARPICHVHVELPQHFFSCIMTLCQHTKIHIHYLSPNEKLVILNFKYAFGSDFMQMKLKTALSYRNNRMNSIIAFEALRKADRFTSAEKEYHSLPLPLPLMFPFPADGLKSFPNRRKSLFEYGVTNLTSMLPFKICLDKLFKQPPIPFLAEKSTDESLEFRSASGFLIVFYFGRGASGIGCDPGGIIYRDIILEYVDYVVPIYEDDFGDIVDMNYLNVGVAEPDYQIFICNLTLCRSVLPVNRLVTEKKAIMVTDEEEENDRTEGCWRFLQPTEKNRASLGEIERARNDD
ncbi:hypothetical protein Ccrd_014304 [Cynara cardunculus var. scolymus]|uniref:Uncharacterized protein n=1 Tax=Cynara cardunculus var. scolymus TaxID=59895 RepID=A0A124SGT1_CYNCS|nr:hypothetical protein Ccrd_014304 [Cynara cardunculus var. scolymus]